jgi:hypothetical protein
VTEWEANYIGHRCRRGKAFLFSRPLLSSCPACGTRIYVDHPEKSAHLPRGPGFANGVIDATPTASSAPLRGTNSAVQDKPNGTNSAAPEHVPATPTLRGFNGKEVGSPGSVPSDEAVDLSEVASQKALQKTRRHVRSTRGRRTSRTSPVPSADAGPTRATTSQGAHTARRSGG